MPTSSPKKFCYLFGPVASRRLGRSLGIDLIPFKTCSYSCNYCQLGPTRQVTVERREWVPTEGVIGELIAWQKSGGVADAITFAGSGEPTLHTGLGQVIDAVHRIIPDTPVVVLTSGALVDVAAVRADLGRADIVKVTVSAANDAVWRSIHAPAPELNFERMIDGLFRFREQFKKTLWVEVMVLDGLNDDVEHVSAIAQICKSLNADLTQLNTPVRPPTESSARAVAFDKLQELCKLFETAVEVIEELPSKDSTAQNSEMSSAIIGVSPVINSIAEDLSRENRGIRQEYEEQVFDLLLRHPCVADDVACSLGIDFGLVQGVLDGLVGAGKIMSESCSGKIFYRIKTISESH